MSYYYGTMSGQSPSSVTKTGSKSKGMSCTLASWSQGLQLSIWHNAETGQDHYLFELIPWQGQGVRKELLAGIL